MGCPCKQCRKLRGDDTWGKWVAERRAEKTIAIWTDKPEQIVLKDGVLEDLERKKQQIQEAIDRLTAFENLRIWRLWVTTKA